MGNVKVEWVSLGEGISGDYDPDNPEDVELLRFDTYVSRALAEECNLHVDEFDDEGYGQPQDGSYCTQVPVGTPPETLERLQREFERELEEGARDGTFRRRAEMLSWTSGRS